MSTSCLCGRWVLCICSGAITQQQPVAQQQASVQGAASRSCRCSRSVPCIPEPVHSVCFSSVISGAHAEQSQLWHGSHQQAHSGFLQSCVTQHQPQHEWPHTSAAPAPTSGTCGCVLKHCAAVHAQLRRLPARDSCCMCLQVCAAQPQHPTTTLQKALSRLAPTCHKLWSAFDWIAEQVMLVSLPAARHSAPVERRPNHASGVLKQVCHE